MNVIILLYIIAGFACLFLGQPVDGVADVQYAFLGAIFSGIGTAIGAGKAKKSLRGLERWSKDTYRTGEAETKNVFDQWKEYKESERIKEASRLAQNELGSNRFMNNMAERTDRNLANMASMMGRSATDSASMAANINRMQYASDASMGDALVQNEQMKDRDLDRVLTQADKEAMQSQIAYQYDLMKNMQRLELAQGKIAMGGQGMINSGLAKAQMDQQMWTGIGGALGSVADYGMGQGWFDGFGSLFQKKVNIPMNRIDRGIRPENTFTTDLFPNN